MEPKKENYNPWPSYFMILAGAGLMGTGFLSTTPFNSNLDYIKCGVGVVSILFGAYSLVKKKKI